MSSFSFAIDDTVAQQKPGLIFKPGRDAGWMAQAAGNRSVDA
jgi:hypothetical protein